MTKLSELEALLFIASEEGISNRELSRLLNLSEAEVTNLVKELRNSYVQDPHSALHILEAKNHYVLTTERGLTPLLKRYAQGTSNTLSQTAAETLAIIAYRQSITRAEIEQIRGVRVSGAVQRLAAHKLVEEKGRVGGPGRPVLYGITGYFLDYFGPRSLGELPDTQEMEISPEEGVSPDLFFDGVNKGEQLWVKRLQKVIVHAGIASRWKVEEFILAGRVKVNRQTVRELGIKVGKHDTVGMDEVPTYQEEYGYYLSYEPKGVTSTVTDNKGRKAVTDLLPMVKERIYPVDRLGYDTPDVLLLIDDEDFAQRLTYPKHEVDKVHVVKIKGVVTKSMLAPLVKRIKIEGRETSPAKFQILSMDPKTNHSIMELTIHEGWSHQVKNTLQVIELPVQKLECEKYGDLTLQGLYSGDYRELNKKEVGSLLSHSK